MGKPASFRPRLGRGVRLLAGPNGPEPGPKSECNHWLRWRSPAPVRHSTRDTFVGLCGKVSRAIQAAWPWTLRKWQRGDESFRLHFWLIDWAVKLLAGAERIKNEI